MSAIMRRSAILRRGRGREPPGAPPEPGAENQERWNVTRSSWSVFTRIGRADALAAVSKIHTFLCSAAERSSACTDRETAVSGGPEARKLPGPAGHGGSFGLSGCGKKTDFRGLWLPQHS